MPVAHAEFELHHSVVAYLYDSDTKVFQPVPDLKDRNSTHLFAPQGGLFFFRHTGHFCVTGLYADAVDAISSMDVLLAAAPIYVSRWLDNGARAHRLAHLHYTGALHLARVGPTGSYPTTGEFFAQAEAHGLIHGTPKMKKTKKKPKKPAGVPKHLMCWMTGFMRIPVSLDAIDEGMLCFDLDTETWGFWNKASGALLPQPADGEKLVMTARFALIDVLSEVAQVKPPYTEEELRGKAQRMHKGLEAFRWSSPLSPFESMWKGIYSEILGKRSPASYMPAPHKGNKLAAYKTCTGHGAGKELFELGNVTVIAASNHATGVKNADLTVDLAAWEYTHRSTEGIFLGRFAALNEFFVHTDRETIELKWQDQEAPQFRAGLLKQIILCQQEAGGGKVAFACMGGHGRTGTAIAALRILFFQESAEIAIKWVRDNYCDHAIESHAQEAWLEKVEKQA